MSYCGECGSQVLGAFCGECGARTVLHPDHVHPGRQAISAAAPGMVNEEANGADGHEAVVPIGATDPLEPVDANAPATQTHTAEAEHLAVADTAARTQLIPVGGAHAGQPAALRSPGRGAPDPTEDLPWVPQSLARAQTRGSEEQPQTKVQSLRNPPSSRRWLIAVISVLVAATAIVAVAFLLGWVDRVRGATESVAGPAATVSPAPAVAATPLASAPETTPQGTPTADATSATPTPPSEEELRMQAVDTLEAIVAEDAGLNPIRGQWVAQLASKYEGVVDPLQRPEPFEIPEILDEVERLRSDPDFGSSVRVVHQGDWGGSEPGDTTMWVTFADIDASTRDQVVSWCESRFSQRGEALLNVCYPREMRLP